MSLLALEPVGTLRMSSHQIPRYSLCPNTSIQHRPLLIYYACLPPSATAASIEAHLAAVGVVEPRSRSSMFRQTHFHSTTHEVLCVAAGRAKLCFGGKQNPGRIEMTVEKGDVMIIPAGVGHCLLDDLDGGFEMVGSYPHGCAYDLCYGREEEEEEMVNAIAQIPWFDQDPLYGEDGLAPEQ